VGYAECNCDPGESNWAIDNKEEIVNKSEETQKTWTEELTLDAGEVVGKVKELIAQGNVRRLIIRKPSDEVLFEIPLTAGVAVGGAAILLAPVLAAVGALAAVLAEVKIQVVRVGEPEETDKRKSHK
jgi:hypothetical protein